MKTVTIDEFRARLDEFLADAASRDLNLTSEGKPWLVLHAIGSGDEQDSTAYAASPEFWRMIHERRQEQGISWEEARKELDQDETGD
jgi:hypothetical protein